MYFVAFTHYANRRERCTSALHYHLLFVLMRSTKSPSSGAPPPHEHISKIILKVLYSAKFMRNTINHNFPRLCNNKLLFREGTWRWRRVAWHGVAWHGGIVWSQFILKAAIERIYFVAYRENGFDDFAIAPISIKRNRNDNFADFSASEMIISSSSDSYHEIDLFLMFHPFIQYLIDGGRYL